MRKIYMFMITVCLAATVNAADKSVAFVHGSQSYGLNDTAIVDTINALDGFTVTRVLCAADLDLSAYDAVIVGESMGSDAIDAAIKAYTFPCIHLKAWGLQKTNITWAKNLFVKIDGFTLSADDVADETELEILEDHDIFTAIGSAGDVFSMADGYMTPPNAGVNMQGFDLTSSAIADIKDNSSNLAKSIFAEEKPVDYTTVLAAIEANGTCERTVCYGTHGNYKLSNASFQMIKNALYWVLEMENPWAVSVETIAESKFKMYPNPAQGLVTIKSEKNITGNIILTDITGKIIDKIVPENNNAYIETSNYNSGIYFVTIDNESLKLIIE